MLRVSLSSYSGAQSSFESLSGREISSERAGVSPACTMSGDPAWLLQPAFSPRAKPSILH